VRFGNRFILKLYRRLQGGVSPDLEIGRMLTERVSFPATPAVAGWVEYHRPRESDATLGVLHEYVANEGDLWHHTLDWLGRYYERVLSRTATEPISPPASPNGGESAAIGDDVANWLGGYLEWTSRLAVRTAELHRSLASSHDPDFAPEPLTKLHQRSIYQSMRNLTGRVMRRLRDREGEVPGPLRKDVRRLLEKENVLLRRFQSLLDRRIGGHRIRCHGDFHLGQVLFTGKDFVIIDFEGEPARPISERRIKRSPLRDVAGMLRSFHYAAYASLPGYTQYGSGRAIDFPKLEPWALFWNRWACATYLRSYLEACPKKLLPSARSDIDLLLDVLLLEKTVYEIGYELDNRPRWLAIPLGALLSKIDPQGSPGEEKK
jgi:maltose alpha-D-glucosyltransferase/alpha-amylase